MKSFVALASFLVVISKCSGQYYPCYYGEGACQPPDQLSIVLPDSGGICASFDMICHKSFLPWPPLQCHPGVKGSKCLQKSRCSNPLPDIGGACDSKTESCCAEGIQECSTNPAGVCASRGSCVRELEDTLRTCNGDSVCCRIIR